jgi:hypothetical protein
MYSCEQQHDVDSPWIKWCDHLRRVQVTEIQMHLHVYVICVCHLCRIIILCSFVA